MKITNRSRALILCTGFIVFFFIAQNVAALDEIRGDLAPKGQTNSAIVVQRLAETWDGKPPGPPVRITLTPDTNVMVIRSTQKVSVYAVNETEMVKGLNSNWNSSQFVPKKTWAHQTSIIETNLTYQHFKMDWGMENFTTVDKEGKPLYTMVFYIVIVNELDSLTQYSFKWRTGNPVVDAMETVFFNLVYMMFFIFGFMLLYKAMKERKNPDRQGKAHSYMNYAWGLIAGGIGMFAWQFSAFWSALDPAFDWSGIMAFNAMPTWVLGGILTTNVLTFLTFICLGSSLMFMSNTIEKDIQNKKIPYLTFFLLITEVLIIVFAFVLLVAPGLKDVLGVIIYVWVVALGLVGVNIVLTYIKVARQSTGILRKKAIIILVSLLVTFMSILLLRNFFNPQFLANSLASFFVIGIYYGLTME
ncbi:MAG: hypothetical protein Q6373_005045 [Candidatus Sigynarchaeota archaeon]